MKKVLKILKNRRHICFLDFEGTQFSHEMIALGAVMVNIDKNGYITKRKHPVKYYVKAKNSIGNFVKNLTGITEQDLDKYGYSFSNAIKHLKKYCGINYKKCIFMTFGNHDMRILNQSIAYNLDAPEDDCTVIKKNYVDFQMLISEFIKDEKNNSLSLAHDLEVFGISFDGQQHDPMYDADNLATLYDSFMRKKDVVLNEYYKLLSHSNINPYPAQVVIRKLVAGESVTPEEFKAIMEDYIA